jgi:3',5'-cyclic AMP phosphodiesterase CpdA
MALAACSDDQFMRLAHELQSVELVAKAIGVSASGTFKRWARLEKKHGIVLPKFSLKTHKPITAAVDGSKAVVNLSIADGVVIVGSDLHIIDTQWTTMQRAFVHFAKKLKPAAVILNGDVADFGQISRHPSIGWETKPSLIHELRAIEEYLGQLAQAAPGAKKVWTLGNHDARFESRIAAVAPEFREVKGIHLKDHFPLWLPCWRCDINDDVVVRHREMGGEHADFRNVQIAGKTIVTGHDHRTGVVPWRNYTGLHWGVRCGYMADIPRDPQFVNYLEGKEPNWHPAFAVLSFKGGRLLWPELVTKHDDGNVEFRGEIVAV